MVLFLRGVKVNMFELHYEPISNDLANSGQIALVPWDIETFGFGVANYKTDELNTSLRDSSRLREHLEAWAKTHEVELVSTTISASDIRRRYFIQSLGFRYIDTTMVVRYERVQSTNYPHTKVTLKPAQKDDLAPVMQICGQVFENGRYHADVRVPRDLADKRYQQWASRTFDPANSQILLVLKMRGEVRAFSIVQIGGEQGYFHLAAVAPQWKGKRIGVGLFASTMCYFQKQGASFVLGKISAANAPVINLHASLGARFSDPGVLLHWHAPWATHLVTVGK